MYVTCLHAAAVQVMHVKGYWEWISCNNHINQPKYWSHVTWQTALLNAKRKKKIKAFWVRKKKQHLELPKRLPHTVKWHHHPWKHTDAVTHKPEQFNLVTAQIRCADGAPVHFTHHHEALVLQRYWQEESGQIKNNQSYRPGRTMFPCFVLFLVPARKTTWIINL